MSIITDDMIDRYYGSGPPEGERYVICDYDLCNETVCIDDADKCPDCGGEYCHSPKAGLTCLLDHIKAEHGETAREEMTPAAKLILKIWEDNR